MLAVEKRTTSVAVAALTLLSPLAVFANTATAIRSDVVPTPIPTPTYVSENPCAPYDLRKDHGAPYEHVPVLDQGPYQACATYSMAGFVDGWIQSHLPNPPVPGTPAHDALRHHATSPVVNVMNVARANGIYQYTPEVPIQELKQNDLLLESLRQNGSCNHLKIFGTRAGTASNDTAILDAFNNSSARYLEFLRDRPRIGAMIDREMSFGRIMYIGLAPIARDLHCTLLDRGLNPSDIPGRLVRDSNPALVQLIYSPPGTTGGSRVEIMAGFFDHACRGDTIRVPIPEVTKENFEPNEATRVVSHLHRLMDRPQKDPILVQFCGRVLERARPFKAYLRGQDASGACHNPSASPRPGEVRLKATSEGRHGAVIIGRKRAEDGSCKVLLRNSWGRSCGSYMSSGWECEQGNVWIDIRDLAENTYATQNFNR